MKIKMFVFMFVLVFLFSATMAVGEAQQKVTQTPRLSLRRLPDLQVKFTCPTTVVAGTDIGSQIKLKVWNSGKAPAAGTDTAGRNGYMVDLMLSTDTNVPAGMAIYSANFSEDVLLQGGRISNTKTLKPGQSKMYPVGGGIPADTPPGLYYICAKVDSGNKITESNEGNNSFCRRVKIIKEGGGQRLPDLRVSLTCPTTIVAGTRVEIKVRVWNAGHAPAAGTDTAGNNGYMVDVMLSTDTNVPAGMAVYSANFSEDVLLQGGRISNTTTLNPGQSKIYVVNGGIPADTPPGGYYICAKVDSGNKITESNEGNNSSCKRVYIKQGSGQPGKPDLIISIINFSPGKPTIKDEITFWVFVKNIGSGPSVPSKLRFQVGGETNPPITPVPALNPGQEFRHVRKARLTVPRYYRVTATADYGNDNIESDEGNNVKYREFRVTK